MKKILLTTLIFASASFLMAQSNLPSDKTIQREGIKRIVCERYDYSSGVEVKTPEYAAVYNDKNQLIEYKEWDNDGKFVLHETYEYDAVGNKVKEVEYNSKGKIEKTAVYKYNGKLRTEKLVYYANGKLKSKKVFSYEFLNK